MTSAGSLVARDRDSEATRARSAVQDIEARLVPINAILRSLPFGAGHDRLKINVRRKQPDTVTRFLRELRELGSSRNTPLSDEEAEERFARIGRFMAKIALPQGGSRATASRDLLLDVREHVEVTAIRVDTEVNELSTYSSLGGKSGGESQELIAFIVGAALRFQLGDKYRTRPRFAPVFLDEGFIKSDSEFAGRAVEAWKGLGFQLIIGAPLDKVTALQPHVSLMLAMIKSSSTGYSRVIPVSTVPPDGPTPDGPTSDGPTSGGPTSGSPSPNGQNPGGQGPATQNPDDEDRGDASSEAA